MMKDTLLEMLKPFGPSGSERAIREKIAETVQPYVDELFSDAMGNLIAVKRGTGEGRRVMFSAHMDTIGLMVYASDEKGFLRVTPLGGVNAAQMAARKVVFENGAEGVVYSEPLPDGKYTMGRLFIDVGAETEEQALKIAPVGSVCSLPLQAAFLGERVSAPYMDNRSACAVLVELVQSLGKTKHDVFAVFSTQEEVGCRGAKAATFALEPDVGIAIDVTVAGGTPKADPPMPVYVGKGPAVKIKDSGSISTPVVRDALIAAARRAGVPFQYEVLPYGGTDASAIVTTRGGIPAGTLSIPCLYVHSPVETVSLRDMEQSVALLKAYVEGLE